MLNQVLLAIYKNYILSCECEYVGSYGGLKQEPDVLELELQVTVVMSHSVGGGN